MVFFFQSNGKTLLQFPRGKKETDYTIPNSVGSIGSSAFAGCTSLKEVTIPRELDITFSEHVKVNRI